MFEKYPTPGFSPIRLDGLHLLPWTAIVAGAFVFLAPNIDFAYALPWNDGQRLAQLLLIALMLPALMLPGAATGVAAVWAGLPRLTRHMLQSAFALGILSSLGAASPRWAFLECGMLLLLIVLGLSIAANRRDQGAGADCLLVMLFSATATAYAFTTCSVYVAMLLVGSSYGQIFDIRELYTSFSNVRFFSHVQTMLLPFLLLPAMWWGTTRTRRIGLSVVPSIWWMLAVGAGTRGTWAALLTGMAVALVVGGNAGRRWAKWQAAGLLCGLICYGIFILGIPKLLDQSAWFLHRTNDILSLSLREVLWATALDYIIQYPWLGVGPMHYAYWATEVAAHPHDAVLQWLAEWGVPAGLLLTGAWAAGGISLATHVRRTAEQGDDRSRLFRVALLAALTGASAQAMVDGVLVMPVSQTLLALLAGWAVGMMPVRSGYVAGRGLRLCLMSVVLISTAAVAYGVAPEIGRLAERQQAYLAVHGPDTVLLPRFWTLGWIRAGN